MENILTLNSSINPSLSFVENVDGVERIYDGPLSAEMWKRVKALNSKMPDTFDWSVYDRLYEKFGDDQPRGGVVFKTAVKLVNHHSSCTKCHYAFEIDTYGRGCVHNCSYCYAKESLTAHGYWNNPIPVPVDLNELNLTNPANTAGTLYSANVSIISKEL